MLTETVVRTLEKSKIFSVLSRETLQKISPLFEKLDFKRDEFVFMEGDKSDWLYIVADARVKMVKHTLGGKEVILEIKSPGEIFCCAAVLDERPFPESAQAMKSATVIRISRQNLLKVMEEYPDLRAGMEKYSSGRLREAHEMLKNIATERVEKRIALMLLKLSEKSGHEEAGYAEIDFPITRQEIADMVGTSVETCIRTMSRFQKDGMVKSSGNKILVNSASLRKLLEE